MISFECTTCSLKFKDDEEAMEHMKDKPLHEIRYNYSDEE